MKPPPFEYAVPKTLDEALEALAGGGEEARALAGGQSLIPMMNFRLAGPSLLVDLNGIPELMGIRKRADGGLTIGAMVRQRQLERNPDVASSAPLLAEAAPWIAHPQIRTRGTVGGSVAHADPASELPAVLLALGATVRAAKLSADGGRLEREIRLDEFFFGPFFTALEAAELVIAVDIPPPGRREGTGFAEVARRRGDYAIVGAAARVRLDVDGLCESVGLVLINAGPAPALLQGAAGELVGGPPSDERIAAAAAVAAAECRPVTDMHGSEAYRRHLVGVLTTRTLATAVERATSKESSGP